MFSKIQTVWNRLFSKQILKRTFSAARLGRLVNDWIYRSTIPNQILRGDLRRMRDRSRDLARNDPWAKKFFHLVRNNVIGKGITLQVRPSGRTIANDSKLSSTVEAAFAEWGKKEFCSVSGRLSWREAQQLFIRHVARDGECIVRKYTADNKFGFAIKFYSPSWLDETYNDTLVNGNRVIMSVEVDEVDRPVAYYLTRPAGEAQRRHQEVYRLRVPASEIIHSFLIDEDEDQARGIPWMHASMMRLKQFDGYEEAELVGKRAEACQMAFLIPPADENQETTEKDEENGTQLIQELEPGAIPLLPPGYDVKNYNPKQDGGALDFKKTQLRGVAAGLDISYHSLAGDLEAVNFSSSRIGALEERDNYSSLQDFVIENFCEPIYRAWLESAFMSSALSGVTLKDMERIRDPFFRGRGWAWTNPTADANAAVTGLKNKFMTLTDILAERGVDIEDHFATIQKERELAKQFKIELEPPKALNPAPEAAN